jgi:ADP-ribose pyrophosphatase
MTRRKLSATVRSVARLSGGFLKVNRYEFETDKHQGGRQVIVREVMERGHAVGVLGYDPQRDEVVLVSEFRSGCFVAGDDAYAENVVAGVIAPGETPIAAAIREMREEAGLDLHNPVLVHPGAYVSSGGSSEKIAIVVGVIDSSQAGGVHGDPDEAEDILTVLLSRQDFLDRARRAEINDLKTLVAAYWLAENHALFRSQPGY